MIGLCAPCKEKGKFRAPYKVIGGVPMCGGCVADREANIPAKTAVAVAFCPTLPAPATEPKKEGTKMAKQIDQDTIDKIRKLYADGKKINEIATELSISWITAKNYAGAGTNGTKPAGGGRKTLFLKKRCARGPRRFSRRTLFRNDRAAARRARSH